MEIKKFRWVQVITTITTTGETIQIVQTTTSTNKRDRLGELFLQHRAEIEQSGYTAGTTMIFWMDSSGNTSSEKLPSGAWGIQTNE